MKPDRITAKPDKHDVFEMPGNGGFVGRIGSMIVRAMNYDYDKAHNWQGPQITEVIDRDVAADKGVSHETLPPQTDK